MCFPIERAECGPRGRAWAAPATRALTARQASSLLAKYDQRPIGRYVKICTLTPNLIRCILRRPGAAERVQRPASFAGLLAALK